MRLLAATTLLACASADETSLLQHGSRAHKLSASSGAKSNRQESTSKLLDTAVTMIKNGVTPDVITFVDATNQDINEEVLVAIQSEHDIDQAYINNLCQDFINAVQALEDEAAAIAVHDANRLAANEAHHTCRAEEAYKCAKSRRCEEQLRQKWVTVKHEESVMREIHGHINDEWCIHPPFFAEIEDWASHPFNWAQTSPYPILDLPQDVRDFRHVSVTHFTEYMEQKIVTERAWLEYNEKLVECAELEGQWEDKLEPCDLAQNTAREHACQHATTNRQAREAFGQEWARIVYLFEQARIAKSANEADRKNEWETLKIVQCLLDHVHSSVVTSIETGAPCPTVDSDPDGVTLAIEDCHIVTRGCGEDSLTGHLCLDWCEQPPIPPLPPVEEPACTPAFIAREQAQFLEAIQASYTTQLTSNSDYPEDLLTGYETVLSDAGWAGCAPPLVCVDCTGSETEEPCAEHTGHAQTCHVHEEYLSAGQSNADTFRCLDGTCISQAGRCNGASNCADESDEHGCDHGLNIFVPAYLGTQSACPDDFHGDVHFRCASGHCIEKVGMCNGIDNCADSSDEAHCSGALQVTVEATSGRAITVEHLQRHTGVFHDRSYNFDQLGVFSGKTFIKYSNDDKAIDHLHVMAKIRTLEPLTVFIVKLDHHGLPWLDMEGYTPTAFTGVSFSGVRETRHKEWDPALLTTDHFAASAVYSKTFPAGTISIPGNNGGDGSFLIFLDRPSEEDEYDSRLTAYWDTGACGAFGNDHNWDWCAQTEGRCWLTVPTDLCPSGEAELVTFHGTGDVSSYVRDGCHYFYHAQYRCSPHTPEQHGADQFIGCFVDDGARDLGTMVGGTNNAATNTFELCREACGDSTYMSLQYGGECFCSNSYGNGAQYVQVDEAECNANNQPCATHSHNCGGTWRQAIYQINAIEQWELIAHHDVGSGWFSGGARSTFLQNENDPEAGVYMNVGALTQSNFLIDGAYHFRLIFTGVADAAGVCNDGPAFGSDAVQEFEWSQTSWITGSAVSGYTAISTTNLDHSPHTGCIFSGVARSSTSATVFDGSSTHGNWFHSIGSTTSWNSGIPAFKGTAAQTMSLYISRPGSGGGGGGPVTPPPDEDCGARPQMANAHWQEGSLAYRCDEGFSFDGAAETYELELDVQCEDGSYTTPQICKPINDCVGHTCGAHGRCVDQHMDYTCNCVSGFEINVLEDGEKICGNIDDCHGHSCGEAGICIDHINDYECQCDDGWRQVIRHDDDLKTCERVECGETPEVENMESIEASGIFPWTRSKAVFEEEVEYTCKPGFTTTGELNSPRSFTINCLANGEYTAHLQCLSISCPAPEPAGGATPVSADSVQFAYAVEYACEPGFGPDTFDRSCLANGEYSPAIACEPKPCGAAPELTMASMSGGEAMFFFGQEANFRCDEGYSTDAANPGARDFALGCLADGWDTHLGCEPVTCEVRADASHAGDRIFSIVYEEDNSVECADGHTVDGTAGGATSLSAVCTAGGEGQLAPCRPVTCEAAHLQGADDAEVQDHRAYTIGNSATYTCSEGFAVANTGATTFEVQCLRSGLFSAMSTCRNIDDCPGHSCGSNGVCVDGINDYSCNCESGFEQEVLGSEKVCGNIDDCGPNACGSYGRCHDLVNGYACECDGGYELQGAGDAQQCVAKTCPLPSWENVVSSVTELRYSQTLVVECANGHEVEGQSGVESFRIGCNQDAAITGAQNCRPKSCGQPPNVGAESQENRNYIFGETSVSVCSGGSVQITHECTADGVFRATSQFHTCRNSCGNPQCPAHAHRSGGAGAVSHPATASFTCNSGFTNRADGRPGGQFSQTCRPNGAFQALTESCRAVVCQRPSLPGNWQWADSSDFNTQRPTYMRCASGYLSSQAAADGRFQVSCNANGQASNMPGACQVSSHRVSGRINRADRPSQGVGGARLVIAGQTVVANSQGHYSVNLPAGTHSYTLSANGYITMQAGSVTVNGAQTFNINMSPVLAADSWRIVLSWQQHPRDLDSHLSFYNNRCPEMYYGRRSASCSGVTARLDVDDTSSYGPETTTLTNMRSCSGGHCKYVYKVKNYSGRYDRTNGWQHSAATVGVYNGNTMVREFQVNSNHGYKPSNGIGSFEYWSVLSIDHAGNVAECRNANCD